MNNEEKTILLVDYEAIICQDQADTLKREGYHVITTMSGEAAIEQFKNGNKIDLFLMDIDLGKGLDGTQARKSFYRIMIFLLFFCPILLR